MTDAVKKIGDVATFVAATALLASAWLTAATVALGTYAGVVRW